MLTLLCEGMGLSATFDGTRMSLGCGTRQGLRTLDFEVFIISQILLRVLILVFDDEIARVGATEGEHVVQLAFGLGLGDLQFVVLPPEP